MDKNIWIIVLAVVFLASLMAAFLYWSNLTAKTEINIENNVNNLEPADIRDKEASIIFVGDIMTSRGVAMKMKANGNDYPFLNVVDYLKSADAVFGNLETSITPGRVIKNNEMYFRSDPDVAEVLKNAGFTILSLANNHTPNFGEKGLLDTFKYLDNMGIKYAGAGKNSNEASQPANFEINGIKFAVLAYTDLAFMPVDYGAAASRSGTNVMNIENMISAVSKAKSNSDVVIISMHSGDEYSVAPNQKQIDFARSAIDAGADLIIGHHPHVVESAEIYKGKYIFYSLGNFVFDQMWSMPTRQGVALKIRFNKDGVAEVLPTAFIINDYSQPQILEGQEAQNVINILKLTASPN